MSTENHLGRAEAFPLTASELAELREADVAGGPHAEPLLLEDVIQLAEEKQRLTECCELLREENRRLRAVLLKIQGAVGREVCDPIGCGVDQLADYRAHTPEVVGSSPTAATTATPTTDTPDEQ